MASESGRVRAVYQILQLAKGNYTADQNCYDKTVRWERMHVCVLQLRPVMAW